MNRLLLTGMLLLGVALLSAGATQGAEKSQKPRKEKAKAASREERSKDRPPRRAKGDSANESISTQQETARAFDEKLGRPSTTQRSAPPSDSQQLKDLETQIKAEDERHQAALAQLRRDQEEADKSGNSKKIGKARKAIEKEQSAYQRKKASLEKQRQALLRKGAPAAVDPPARGGQAPTIPKE